MTTDTVGGVWSYTLDVAAGLAAQGLEVTLAVLGPSPHRSQMPRARRGVTVINTGLPLDWLAEDEVTLVTAGQDLAQMARQVGADIIHLNSSSYAADAPFDAPVVGMCHSCLATWWDAVRGEAAPQDVQWRSERLARGYAACDLLIAPSQSFAQATAARYGMLPTTIPNGRSICLRPARPKQPFVMTSGRLWDAGKNIAALDVVAALMDGEVRAAGSLRGPDGSEVALHTVTSLGILDQATMREHLARAAIFASLALYEPFGLGVLEAALLGCALVLSDIPTFRELWSDAAIFVDPDEPHHVARVLDALLNDPEEAARLGQLAAQRAARFSVDRMVAGTRAVYGTLCPAFLSPVDALA